ncbi:MAG: endo alpha-1,4 polygalactosaminidase [Polyangiaceae bacterium]
MMRIPLSLLSLAALALIFNGCATLVGESSDPGALGGGTAGAANAGAAENAGTAPTGAGGGDNAAGASPGPVGHGGNVGNVGNVSNGGKNGVAGATSGDAGQGDTAGPGTWDTIPSGSSWQWQLTGPLDQSFAVQVYDIDLYDNSAAAVSALHAKGVQVICYVSVGSYEDWRPDAAEFPKAVLGKDYPGWPGEKFLDIRALDTLGPIMSKRLDLCASKGFDGVEPDNMDVFEGGMPGTGFPLTEKDGLAYAQWLTTQAHARGLSIGQKNTSELAGKLATVMDWALTEDCFDGDWCADMQPYIEQGKAVLMSEYTDTGVNFGKACTWAKAHQFSAILKGRDLDAPVQFCP